MTNLGHLLKEERRRRNLTLEKVGRLLGYSASYLSRVERQQEEPSETFLLKLGAYYGLENSLLLSISGYPTYRTTGTATSPNIKQDVREEVSSMSQEITVPSQRVTEIQVEVPSDSKILYCDAALTHASEFGIVFDFAQRQGPTPKQQVVARVGMSYEHAAALHAQLTAQLARRQAKK
ncbi:helix-turn-helix domain-containing protein [Candidatus Berkelbacteria bacterium]|nr:helix-turn-helix domain-containing protein [Candidatus Berkelbacteria bacterium]